MRKASSHRVTFADVFWLLVLPAAGLRLSLSQGGFTFSTDLCESLSRDGSNEAGFLAMTRTPTAWSIECFWVSRAVDCGAKWQDLIVCYADGLSTGHSVEATAGLSMCGARQKRGGSRWPALHLSKRSSKPRDGDAKESRLMGRVFSVGGMLSQAIVQVSVAKANDLQSRVQASSSRTYARGPVQRASQGSWTWDQWLLVYEVVDFQKKFSRLTILIQGW